MNFLYTHNQKEIFLFLLLFIICENVFAQTIHYVPLNTEATLAAKTIDVNLSVGAIPGEASVAQNGSTNYSIPIEVPVGTRGVAPQLAIVYNSQSTDGHLGQGWQLGGLSAITRGGQSFHFDGKRTAVQLNTEDRFYLDGGRLVLKSGTYGGHGAVYRNEYEDFASIRSYGAGTQQWFIVERKDGVVLEYGATADARFIDESNSHVLFWQLNRIQHQDGNYIDFKYVNGSQDHRIDEILYTGNTVTGMAPYNKIKFHYKQRTDQSQKYEAHTSIANRYLMDRIVLTGESGQNFKTYLLTYSFDGLASRLNQIQELGTTAAALNSTIFKYGDIPQAFSSGNSSILVGASADLFSGDFDGDGYSDLLTAPFVYQNGFRYHTKLELYKRTASNPNYSKTYSTSLPDQSQLGNYFKGKDRRTFITSDYNGDGRDDVLVLQVRKIGSFIQFPALVSMQLYESTGNSFTSRSLPVPPLFQNIIHSSKKYFYPGDFDGDGLMDYLLMLGNFSTYKAYVSFPGRDIYNEEVTGLGNINDWVSGDNILGLDFDGDGKQELMRIDENNSKIFTFRRQGYSLGATEVYSSNFPTKDHLIYLADFNGDQKTDLLVRNGLTNINGNWEVAISTGRAFDRRAKSFQRKPQISGSNGDDRLVMADFNGDGRTDILQGWNDLSTSNLRVYYSRGDDFVYQTHAFSKLLGYVPLLPFDLNGDGRADLVSRTHYQSPFDILYFKKEGKEHLLESVVDGFLERTDFVYRRMTQTTGFYTKGTGSTFPVNDIQLPLYLAYQLKKDNGNGGDFIEQFAYAQAKLHRQGKGLLGFQKFTEHKLTEDTRIETTHESVSPYYLFVPKQIKQTKISTGFLFHQLDFTNQFVANAGRSFWHGVAAIHEQKLLEGQQKYTQNTFDTFGNIIRQTRNDNAVLYTTESSFGQFGTPVPAKPMSIVSRRQRSGQAAHELTTKLFYNSIGQLQRKEEFDGLPKEIQTTYTYDLLGNTSSVTIASNGLSTRSTQWAFDSKGRYAIRETNPLGQVQTATYNSVWGKPLTVNGVDGLQMRYTYDAFGRLSRTYRPDGNFTEEFYRWTSDSGPAVYYHQKRFPAAPEVRVFYDKLMRQTSRQMMGFQSEWLFENWTYDERGRMKTARAPYKSGETTFTTTYQYDTYDRPTGIQNPHGTTSYTYQYANGIATVATTHPDGRQTSVSTDASSRKIQSADDGGTINFEYNSQGLLIKTRVDGDIIVSNDFDLYGRQTQMTDQNAGTFLYDYNAFGELVEQTNAQNASYQMTYDKLGRITSRTGPDEGRFYNYYPAGQPGANQLYYISNRYSSDNEFYFYDDLGRLEQKKMGIDGVDYRTYYAYDNKGQLISKTYPSGFDLEYEYETGSGYLTRILHDGGGRPTVLFQNQGMNGKGQYTAFQLGNNPSSSIEYSEAYPTRYSTAGIQDLIFSWDFENGNLIDRSDLIKGKTEDFSYDVLNRLKSAEIAGQMDISVTYAANGNVLSKTDIGQYTYAASRKQAVKKVSNPSGQIPHTTQDITYTTFDQPSSIREGQKELRLTYGHHRQRIKSEHRQQGEIEQTRYHLGEYEILTQESGTQQLHYIHAGQGLVAIVVRQNGEDQFYYTYTDHLGSILSVTDHGGRIIAEQNFDAWGRKRNADTWEYTNITSVPDWLSRAYAGHEYYDDFGLINLNGRLYDPFLGRTLSPDNFTQAPSNSQTYNRYSYVFNNPLKYTDPNGEIVWAPILIGAAVGAVTHVATHFFKNDFSFQNWSWASFAASVVAGGVGGGVGAALKKAGIGGFYAGAITGGSTGLSSSVTKGLFKGNLNLKKVLLATASSAVVSGLAKGVRARLEGRRFLDGAKGVKNTLAMTEGIKKVRQTGDQNCIPACTESVSGSLGETMTQEEARALFPGTNPDTEAIYWKKFWAKYEANSNHNVVSVGGTDVSLQDLVSRMNAGDRIVAALDRPGGIGHAVVLESIVEETWTKVNGATYNQILYRVMDPATGTFNNLTAVDMRSVLIYGLIRNR